MDSEMDRNPSPPPEILNNEDLLPDRIGNSSYSKKWLFQTLMDIVEGCDKPFQGIGEVPKNESTTNPEQDTETVEIESDMIELDPKIEQGACTLWDMSASKDVADFLNEIGIPDIILDIIEKTKSPRLLEIMIGILGNLSSFDPICQSISENQTLMCTILHTSGTSDTPTLLQVFRVILCGVCNQNIQHLWFEAFDENSIFFDNLKFIFENSLNCIVLSGGLQVLYNILNENIGYCRMWGEQTFLYSVIEAGKQLLKLEECMNNFFVVLNALCQYTPTIEELVSNWTELNLLFIPYIISLEEEVPLPESDTVAAVFSCFEAYNSILNSPAMKPQLVTIDVDALKSIRRLAVAVNTMVLEIRKENLKIIDMENPIPDHHHRPFITRTVERHGRHIVTMMTEYEFNRWTMLGDVLVETGKALMPYAEKETDKEILEEIVNSEVTRENIGVLII